VRRFVVDASVALSWIFADEFSPFAEDVLEAAKESDILVPVVWPLEIANALLVAVRRARLPEADAPRLLGIIDRLQIELDQGLELEPIARTTLSVGFAYGLSAYDASYLELAIRRGLPLATQDARLARAAAAAGIDLLQP
jgi:predicted nucleic acid-binding protein